MGGRPQWFLATVLLPAGQTTTEDVERIFQDVLESCRGLGISLIGGHTEITSQVDRPVIVGQMLGEAEKEKLVCTSGARAGDAIILTKGIAVEGTAIIAREHARELASAFGEEIVSRCKNFIYQPGISVLKEALIAGEIAHVHAMHDPTEGGLASALHEIVWAAQVGLVVYPEAIPVFPETRMLCEYYGIDPMGLIASGALLIVIEEPETERLLASLHEAGVPASVIGRVVAKNEGVKIKTLAGLRDLPMFEQDELTKVR